MQEKSGDFWVGESLKYAIPPSLGVTPDQAALTVEIHFSNDSIVDLIYCEINTANTCITEASEQNFKLRTGEKKVVLVNLGRTWKISDTLKTLAIYRLLRKQTPDISQIRIVSYPGDITKVYYGPWSYMKTECDRIIAIYSPMSSLFHFTQGHIVTIIIDRHSQVSVVDSPVLATKTCLACKPNCIECLDGNGVCTRCGNDGTGKYQLTSGGQCCWVDSCEDCTETHKSIDYSDDIGMSGGTCTCPNGIVGNAGAYNRTGKLACVGGTPSKKIQTTEGEWSYKKFICTEKSFDGMPLSMGYIPFHQDSNLVCKGCREGMCFPPILKTAWDANWEIKSTMCHTISTYAEANDMEPNHFKAQHDALVYNDSKIVNFTSGILCRCEYSGITYVVGKWKNP